MKKCAKNCINNNKNCSEKECKAWINYKKDFNCCNISIQRHGNMTLAQVAKRLNLSIVRVKQIQDKALQKLRKKRHLKAL